MICMCIIGMSQVCSLVMFYSSNTITQFKKENSTVSLLLFPQASISLCLPNCRGGCGG